jgi:hypothetical protein
MRRDSIARIDVRITPQATILIDSKYDYQKKLELETHVDVFWKKHHKLTWTFLNTMNNVHHCYTLYNDISPDNVLLHFPPNFPDKVYVKELIFHKN